MVTGQYNTSILLEERFKRKKEEAFYFWGQTGFVFACWSKSKLVLYFNNDFCQADFSIKRTIYKINERYKHTNFIINIWEYKVFKK